MNNIVHLIDNMKFMKTIPDKFFSLSIVDPPYGFGEVWKKWNTTQLSKHKTNWDNKTIPNKQYFDELFRISENQIIWGYNYFCHELPITNHLITWDKDRDVDKTHLSECEHAWTSIPIPSRIIKITWDGFRRGLETNEKRYHPCQKPVALYKWLLKNYAKPGWTIFDSHVGSGSIRIACHDMGFDFTGCELDVDYFNAQEERFKNHIAQSELFENQEIQASVYEQGEELF